MPSRTKVDRTTAFLLNLYIVSDDGNIATQRRWILRLETGGERHDIKLQVFTTLKDTERLVKDRKRRRSNEIPPSSMVSFLRENDGKEEKMAKCLEMYKMELQAMPESVLDWELKKLSSRKILGNKVI